MRRIRQAIEMDEAKEAGRGLGRRIAAFFAGRLRRQQEPDPAILAGDLHGLSWPDYLELAERNKKCNSG